MIPSASRDAVLYAEAEDGELIGYRVSGPSIPANVHDAAARRGPDEHRPGHARPGHARPDHDRPDHARPEDGAPEDGAPEDGAPERAGGAGEASALPPVLLVHGFASDAEITWVRTGWVRALTDAGRVVITLDLRGHGASDKPVDAAAYAPEVFGADLAAVLDSAGADRVDAVGYSMGNRVIAALAGLAPERLRRVVIGGAGPNELFASWSLDEVRALLLRDEPTGHPLIEQVLRPAIAAGADREALLGVVEGFAGARLDLPRGIRSLFVVGGDDPVPVGARELAAEWGSDVVTIPGRDHVSTLTARAFKDAAIAFLADP